MIRLFHEQKIGFVVAEKDFWTDLPSTSRFLKLFDNESFSRSQRPLPYMKFQTN